MQSSIWKIVSAVGIVGIGTLVVLEVQHRLPPAANVAGNSSEDPAAPPGLAESVLTPDSETDFDRLISDQPTSAMSSTLTSDGNRPDGTKSAEALAVSGTGLPGAGHGEAAFDFSEPTFAADSSSGRDVVDTTVRRNQLTDSANPFQESAVTAPAPSDNGAEVRTASFQQDGFFGADSVVPSAGGSEASGNSADDSSAGDSSVPLPREPAAFPSLDEPSAAPQPSASPQPSADPQPSAAPSSVPNLMFFGDDSSVPAGNAPADSLPAFDAPEPKKTQPPIDSGSDASGFDNPFTEDRPEIPGAFGGNGSPSGDGSSKPTAQPEPAVQPLPSAQPTPDPAIDFFSDDSRSATPAADIPAPRRTQPTGPDPAANDPFSDDPFRSTPEPADGKGPGEMPEFPVDEIRDAPPLFDLDSPAATPPGSQRGSRTGQDLPGNRPRTRSNDGLPDRDDDFPAIDLPFPEPGNIAPAGGEIPSRRTPSEGSGRDDLTGPKSDNPFDIDFPAPGTEEIRPLDSASGTSTDSVTTETLRPHVSIRKDAPETASVGIPLEYTIVVTNEGQSTAYDVVIEDQLGRGISLVSTTPNADFDRSSGKLSWKIGQLQPAQTQEFVVRATPTSEGTMDGIATVRFKAQVRATTVITAPRLSLQLTGASEVKLGDEVVFRYVVRNEGTGVARDVILRSVLPLELRHSEGRDLEYEISSLAPQEEREILLTVIAAERSSDVIRNTAEVTSAGIATATAETEIRIVAEQLTVERLGPDRRYVGRPAQFQNIITNSTNFEALNAVVLEEVPRGMRFVSAPGGDYNPDTRLITWKLARIAPGKQVLLDVELMPETAGPLDAVVEVIENAGFRSKAIKTVSVEDLHNVSADISRMDGPVAVGEKFNFTITVDNRGTATANEVELIVQVPPEIKILAAGSKEQGIAARLGKGNMILYNPVVKVEPNELKTFQLVLQGQEPVRNGVVKAQLKYAEMQEPLVVSESVTVYSDSL